MRFKATIYVEKITEALHEAGYERNGNEVLYCPQTGKRMAAQGLLRPDLFISGSNTSLEVKFTRERRVETSH